MARSDKTEELVIRYISHCWPDAQTAGTGIRIKTLPAEQRSSSVYHSCQFKGNEVAFGSIGDASTSEGHFWETINAAGVLQVPMALSVYDDGYGISVPKKYQTTKGSISDILRGFESEPGKPGILIFKGKGWDYPGLMKLYERGN